jgi:hypothetical protein
MCPNGGHSIDRAYLGTALSPRSDIKIRTIFGIECGQRALFDRRTILDYVPSAESGLGNVMGLDAGAVLKRSVLCPHCHENSYFTRRAIADNPELRCPGCGGPICPRDSVNHPLLGEVRNILEAIDSVQSASSFIFADSGLAV